MMSAREDFSLTAGDGLRVACYRWPAAKPAVAALQISHGMGEHALRYARLAEYVGAAGFVTYANDHRGHGRTAPNKESLGDFGAGGWNALVDDMAVLTRQIRTREPDLPIVLLGHSMGSFALQQYLLDHSNLIDAAAISGSAAVDLLQAPTSGGLEAFNAEFEPARTPFDWLSRDSAEVDKYVADPLCGFTANDASRASMFTSMVRVIDPAELKRIRKEMPIYIVAGDRDPLNRKLAALKPLAERYRAAGIKNVVEKYYRDGRHEMLNETNRDEVMRDLLAWMRSAVAQKS